MSNQPDTAMTTSRWKKPLAGFAFVFGILTLISGGSVIFGPAEAQAAAGNYIGFVVWFNFIAGAAYVVAAIGLWLGKAWAGPFAAVIALLTAVVAIGFAVVVLQGAAFEMRTVGALILRAGFWTFTAFVVGVRLGSKAGQKR